MAGDAGDEGPEATEPVTVDVTLDLRFIRCFQALLSLLAVLWDASEVSESVSPSLSVSLLDELPFMMSAKTPGCDSSSMTC